MHQMDKGWLRTGQVARRLGNSQEYVRVLIAKGRLRAIRTPLGRLISEQSVAKLIAERAAANAR